MKRMLFSCTFLTSLLFPLHAKAEWVCRTLSGEVSVGEGTLIRNLMFEYAIGLVAERRQEVGLAEAGPGGSIVPYS